MLAALIGISACYTSIKPAPTTDGAFREVDSLADGQPTDAGVAPLDGFSWIDTGIVDMRASDLLQPDTNSSVDATPPDQQPDVPQFDAISNDTTGPQNDVSPADTLSPCLPNPCQNAATCQPSGGDYGCVCTLGYQGKNCEINIDDCASKPCLNGGTCIDGVAQYTCQCVTGFAGPTCSLAVKSCADNPCQNGATCTNGASNTYTCTCNAGYSGTNCETLINNCSPNPCQNGGACINGVGTHTCTCATGYTGASCATLINNCSPNPCQSGGTCANGVGTHTCTCVAGYTGTNCETLINNCSPDPCQNGATCANGVNSHTCSCINGYTGTNCQTPPNYCSPNPCQNGGTCASAASTYTCSCTGAWTGTNCTSRFTWLPIAAGWDTASVQVYGISGDGSTVVGAVNNGTGGIAWQWRQAGGVTVLSSVSEYAWAYGVSANGSVVAGYQGYARTPPTATKWVGGAETTLGTSGDDSTAFAVSGDGISVVGFDPNSIPSVWNSGGFHQLLSSTHSSTGAATGTNSDGTVVVGYWADFAYSDPTTYQPFYWSQAAGVQPLGLGAYSYGIAQGVSADGNVAVGGVGGYPARWVGFANPVILSALTLGTAYAASQDGSVVAGTTGVNGERQIDTPTSPLQQAFIWTSANGLRLLQNVISTAPSGNMMYATGISADGKTVVGYGNPPSSSYSRGWIATLP